MATIRLTKEFSFEMAHTLDGYDGACREIHGHSYRLFVTIKGMPVDDPDNPTYGMVMDFGELKRIVGGLIIGRFDHTLVIRRTSDNEDIIEALQKHYKRLEIVDYQPTCENMVALFADIISKELPKGVELYAIKLHETATSFAEWKKSDNA